MVPTHENWKMEKGGFSVSAEPEQSPGISPQRQVPRAPLLFWATLPLLQTGLATRDSPVGSGFLDSTQTTVLPTQYNWDDCCLLQLYASYTFMTGFLD